MDRAVHSASAKQRGISSVHDRVDCQFGDICLLRRYSALDRHTKYENSRIQEFKKSRIQETKSARSTRPSSLPARSGHLLDFLTKSRLGPSINLHIKKILAGLQFN